MEEQFSAHEDLGAIPKRQTYEEILARSIAGKPQAELTEQERAARLVESRERMRKMDELFRDEFMSVGEERLVSLKLARMLGFPEHGDVPE